MAFKIVNGKVVYVSDNSIDATAVPSVTENKLQPSYTVGANSTINVTDGKIPYKVKAAQAQWELENEGVPRYRNIGITSFSNTNNTTMQVPWIKNFIANRLKKGIRPLSYDDKGFQAFGLLTGDKSYLVNKVMNTPEADGLTKILLDTYTGISTNQLRELIDKKNKMMPISLNSRENQFGLFLGVPGKVGTNYLGDKYKQTMEVSPESSPYSYYKDAPITYRYNKESDYPRNDYYITNDKGNARSINEGGGVNYKIGDGLDIAIKRYIGVPYDLYGLGGYTLRKNQDQYGNYVEYNDDIKYEPIGFLPNIINRPIIQTLAPGSKGYPVYSKMRYLNNPLFQFKKTLDTNDPKSRDKYMAMFNMYNSLLPYGIYPLDYDEATDPIKNRASAEEIRNEPIWKLNRDGEQALKDYYNGYYDKNNQYHRLFDVMPEMKNKRGIYKNSPIRFLEENPKIKYE